MSLSTKKIFLFFIFTLKGDVLCVENSFSTVSTVTEFRVPKSIDKFVFIEPKSSNQNASSKLQYSAGTPAADSQFPFVCEIRIQLPKGECFVCTGSLVGANWVVSARHCVENKPNAFVQILIGSADRQTDRASYFADKSFSPLTLDDDKPDIVLLHLSESVTMSPEVQPIRIISSIKAEKILEGSQVTTLVGWGQTTLGVFSRHLQYTQFRLVSRTELNLGTCYYASRPLNRRSQSLGGDSGGPMFIKINGVPVQIGVNIAYVTIGNSTKVFQKSTMMSKFLTFLALHINNDAS